jgi:ribonuclease HI
MLVEVFSDGSATTGDKPGGFAFVICVGGIKVAEGSGHLAKATNNVAEIAAAIAGLEYVSTHDLPGVGGVDSVPEVTLVSDSKLVLGYASGEYQCKAMHLLPLMLKLRKLYRSLNAKTRWVKGHAGDEHNERCDVLAKAAREATPDPAADSHMLGDEKVGKKPHDPAGKAGV